MALSVGIIYLPMANQGLHKGKYTIYAAFYIPLLQNFLSVENKHTTTPACAGPGTPPASGQISCYSSDIYERKGEFGRLPEEDAL